MSKHNAVMQITLGMFTPSSHAAALDDDLIIDDNFHQTASDIAARPVNEDGMVVLVHEHPIKQMFILALICTQGRIRIRMDLKDYEVRKGDIILVFPGIIIDTVMGTPDTKAAFIAFSDNVFFEDDNDASIKVIRKNMLHPIQMHLNAPQMQMQLSLYRMLRSVLTKEDFQFRKDATGGILRLMAAGLAQWILENGDPSQQSRNRNEQLFVNFLQEVQSHCSTERRITYYARQFGISPKYFAKLVHDASGRHASDWIRDYVILEAKAMLRTGTYTVQQVSDALHFPNSSFFGKYFKAAVGCSPRKYALGDD